MVRVIGPFFSVWASGTIGKLITCRAMFNQRFCMHRHRHTQRRRSPAQIEVQEIFARKIRLATWFWRVANWRSARLRMNKLGLCHLGSPADIIIPMFRLPPMYNIEQEEEP